MEAFLERFSEMDSSTLWGIKIFVTVFATLIVDFIFARIITKIRKHTEKTENLWDDAFFHALRRPVRLLIWIVGITLAAEIAFGGESSMLSKYVTPVRDVGSVVAFTWFFLRFIAGSERNIIASGEKRKEWRLDETTIGAISKLLKAAVWITSFLIALQTLGFSIGGVLAFGGIGGMAIGFAAKDLLANFFGALIIYFDRPFKVGDWIRSPDQEIEGTVEHIGWRITRIRTFDKRPLYVPNAIFTSISVENPSRMTHRRINEVMGIRYDDIAKMDVITKDVENMLREHKDIDDSQTLMVHMDNFAASSVDFFIYTFTHTTDWVEFHGIKQDVMLKIAGIIEEHGSEMAYPTTTIHVPDGIAVNPEMAGLVTPDKA